jgi:hypothetical protein
VSLSLGLILIYLQPLFSKTTQSGWKQWTIRNKHSTSGGATVPSFLFCFILSLFSFYFLVLSDIEESVFASYIKASISLSHSLNLFHSFFSYAFCDSLLFIFTTTTTPPLIPSSIPHLVCFFYHYNFPYTPYIYLSYPPFLFNGCSSSIPIQCTWIFITTTTWSIQ